MRIKNRLLGSLSGVFAASLSRAEKVARAELGCVAVAPVVFLPATRAMVSRLVESLRKRKTDGDAYRGRIGARDVSVVNTGVGTPSAEGKVLACLGLGAKVFLRFDVCGGLEAGMNVGDVFVAERAVPFDNTTRLLAGGEEVSASPLLLRVAKDVLANARPGLRYREVAVATVDTFHHQTDEMHRDWGRKAAAVDMETSIIYHLARRAGAHALAVMAVSDVRASGLDPFGDGPFPYKDLYLALGDLAWVAVEIVKKLPAALAPLE
jgi:purine-nucleoside phosphorylase